MAPLARRVSLALAAAALAAAFKERAAVAGKKVGLVLCGANVDRDVFARVLAG